MFIKIGDLAKRAGLTVRTLHHYDKIGLLSPAARSGNGFRLYNQDDVIRLQRIQALKQFGFSLSTIQLFLAGPQASLTEIITQQMVVLEDQIQRAQTLHYQLSRLNEQLSRGNTTDLPDWMTILEVMAMFEKRFSRHELDLLRTNKVVGNLDCEWRDLIAQVQDLMHQKTPAEDVEAQEAAQRWMRLLAKTTGNDPALALKLKSLHKEEEKAQHLSKVSLEMIEYIRLAKGFPQGAQTSNSNPSLFVPKPTAFRVAQLRAVHQLLDSPLVFSDPLALKIIGVSAEEKIREDPSRYNEPFLKGLRTSLVVRSRLAEDEWAKSYQEGLRQYVVLGAGLDTFAYRNRPLEDIRIFEVDLPETQQWKRECLRAAGITVPASLSFVTTDFESLTLPKALKQAGFHHNEPGFFSWLGVTMYLEESAILQTLEFIATLPPGSVVVFDYGVVPALLTHREQKVMEILAKKVAERGEPWKTFFDPAVLTELLSALGFKTIEDFGPKQLNSRYLSGRTDGLRKSGVTRLICARV